jgi:hypothetical protein
LFACSHFIPAISNQSHRIDLAILLDRLLSKKIEVGIFIEDGKLLYHNVEENRCFQQLYAICEVIETFNTSGAAKFSDEFYPRT